LKDDKAQMMVLESIFFAIMVVVALTFLIQISPTSIQSAAQVSNDLKTLGDDALDALYAETLHVNSSTSPGIETNTPSNKLAVCIITNRYYAVTDSINSSLPVTAQYNIYISNGTKTIFWCNSTGGTNEPLRMIDPVAISHHPVSIDPMHLVGFDASLYDNGYGSVEEYSDIAEAFLGNPPYDAVIFSDNSTTYDVILEMSDMWIS
jgi:hypothetical protein